jgi:outer membrane protein assembly factor BamD
MFRASYEALLLFFRIEFEKNVLLSALMKRICNLFFGFICLLAICGCSHDSISKILKNGDVEYRLRMAEKFFATKKYAKAQLLYEGLFPLLKNDPRFEDLYYKYAYCAYYQQDYLNAENLYKGFLEVFPKSQRASEVDFMRAYCFYKQSPRVELDQTPTQKAIGFLQAHLNNYPESPKSEEAIRLIGDCYRKMEAKEWNSAQLYYNLGSYRAAAIAFTNLLNHYPQSENADQYKLMIIKAYYEYAQMSVEQKQEERFGKVVEEYYDFADRFPESKLLKEAERYFQYSQKFLKTIKNESSNQKS